MVKDLKYILKRILIGVGIALVLMFLKGGLIADVNAAGNNYTIYLENTTNSNYNTSANTNTYLYVSGIFNRISVVNNNYNLQNDGKYELYSTITIGIDRGSSCTSSNFGLRGDFYIGNSRRTQWINPTTTWNNVDDINVGNNGYCNYTWGSVQTFTSNISSNGFTYDFYFTNPTSINYIKIDRFDLVNTGSTTSDAINNMTNQIINNNNNNTNNIINNQNENTQNIINNQNENTDKEIESQKVCNLIDSSYISFPSNVINSAGNLTNSQGWGATDFIPISKDSKIYYINATSSSVAHFCFYNSQKSKISCTLNSTSLDNTEITIPNNAYYIRASINTNNQPNLKVCKNGNQALNDSMNDLNNNITDDSYDDIGGDITDIKDLIGGDFTTNTPISDLLLMPFTLLNAYSNGIDSSCSSINLGSLFGTDLILPCIDIPHYIGTNLWNIIDLLFCLFLTYNLGMMVVNMYDSITSLNSGFESLYTPQHGPDSYKPRHGGDN